MTLLQPIRPRKCQISFRKTMCKCLTGLATHQITTQFRTVGPSWQESYRFNIVIFHDLSPIKPTDLFTMSPHPGTCSHRLRLTSAFSPVKLSPIGIPSLHMLPRLPPYHTLKRCLPIHCMMLCSIHSCLFPPFSSLLTELLIVFCTLLILIWYIPPVIPSTP